MHTIFASRDAVYRLCCSGNRLETYADTPAGVFVRKAVEQAPQFVQLLLEPIAALEQLDSAQHN